MSETHEPSQPDAATTLPAPSPLPPARPPAREERERSFQPLLYLKLAVLVLVGVYVILFVIKNTRDIRIDYVFGSAKVSLIFEMILLLVAGLVGGMLLSQLHRHRRAKQRRQAGDAR